ncbi:PQQ-binding-like beta-propeller repeat protein [Streptomyces sp. NPDC002734]|uniref:outer membrane protein assembly factor BamB family protein n=1 Tax=Streptomyces sp. NPDC002734 TaxID=3154426 RepID=UPI00331C1E36
MTAATRSFGMRLGGVCLAAVTLLTFTGSPQAANSLPGLRATAAESSDATLGYRADGRADGYAAEATAAPPFRKLWSRDFGAAVSAPVAIGDKVYAVVNADDGTEGGPRMVLVGLRAATGKNLWPPVTVTDNEPDASVTYGGGLLYTQTSRGTIAAWDPATGRKKWSVRLEGASVQYPVAWYGGMLYLQDGVGNALALRATTGARVWTAPLSEYGWSPTVVDSTGVWIGFDDIAWHHLDLRTGAELHRFEVPDIWGAYGNPVALGAGAVWVRGGKSSDPTVTAYDRKTGAAVRTLPADATPAFGPGRVYVAHQGKVRALSTSTYKAAWTYTSSVGAATVRLVANGHVYVQDADGRLVVLDDRTGKAVWSYRLHPAPHPQTRIVAEDDWRGFVPPGIATARGRLFVPGAEGTLIGFGKG